MFNSAKQHCLCNSALIIWFQILVDRNNKNSVAIILLTLPGGKIGGGILGTGGVGRSTGAPGGVPRRLGGGKFGMSGGGRRGLGIVGSGSSPGPDVLESNIGADMEEGGRSVISSSNIFRDATELKK